MINYAKKTAALKPLWFKLIFKPLSWIFMALVCLRLFFFKFKKKQQKLNGYAISVGNILAGGMGKTPFVYALAEWISKELKLSVCIVSRGYGAKLKHDEAFCYLNKKIIWKTTNISADTVADEALMLSAYLPQIPVIVSPSKQVPNKFLDYKVYIYDDAFSSLNIHRDLDLLLMDEEIEAEKNMYWLPYGLMREPKFSIKRAHAWIRTRSQGRVLPEVIPGGTFSSTYRWITPTKQNGQVLERGSKVFLITGIAYGHRVVADLKKAGYEVVKHLELNDHELLNESILEQKIKFLDDLTFFVMTQKDFIRQEDIFIKILKNKLYICDIRAELNDELKKFILQIKVSA